MSDIGFSELILIAIVGLIVIGPQKLPHAIRTCALWIGRVKRSISETRREIEQQLGADDIRRELQNEQVMRNLEKLKDSRDELEARIRSLGNDPYLDQSPVPGGALIESTDHVHHHAESGHAHTESGHAHADSGHAHAEPIQDPAREGSSYYPDNHVHDNPIPKP
jgi:sec-independent protein translocase protein TatB